MLDRFMIFESKNDIDLLKSNIMDVFAYISDETNVTFKIEGGAEVCVEVKTILPSSVTHDDITKYIDKHEKWHEILLDINVAIEQITIKGNIGYTFSVNTVGNVKIRFHIVNDVLYTMDNNNITVSTLNLTKMLGENINHIEMNPQDRPRDLQAVIIYFESSKTPAQQRLLSRKIINLFSRNGLHTTGSEGIKVDTNPYDVNNMTIKFFFFKKNFKNRYKNVKIQYVI